MTLADLFMTLVTRGVLPRAKDCKTALRLLANALGYPSLEACQVEAACRDESLWGQALETHFTHLQTTGRMLSGGNRRNIRSNVRTVFKVAKEHGLLQAPLPPVLLAKPKRLAFRLQQQATAPYKTTYQGNQGSRRFWLAEAQWPPDIQAGWRAYQAKSGHRATTFRSYAKILATYLGWRAHIAGVRPQWDDLFDPGLLREFVRWHGARLGSPMSTHGYHVATVLAAMAKVMEHPASQALAEWTRTLRRPAPMHNKRAHWVSLAEVEGVAEDCLNEGRAPFVVRSDILRPGAVKAGRFQRGLILKLLVRVPLRSRNVREMQLGKHLAKDSRTGHWHLEFAGDDLKVAYRGTQVNRYALDLTTYAPEFVPLLEEFVTVYRPRIQGSATSPYVFLTQSGNPFCPQTLRVELSEAVAMRTGKRFYPHLIRTIWATEYLRATQDYATAATMLGDTLAVVIKTYYHIVHEEQHAKAKAFLDGALHTG
jgi:hypothetical protein